jgi:hypothetical protein
VLRTGKKVGLCVCIFISRRIPSEIISQPEPGVVFGEHSGNIQGIFSEHSMNFQGTISKVKFVEENADGAPYWWILVIIVRLKFQGTLGEH